MISKIKALIAGEPVLARIAAAVVVGIAAALGFDMNASDAITVVGVLTGAGAISARSKVSPVDKESV